MENLGRKSDLGQSDLELLRKARQGDEAAFRALVDRYADRLYRTAWSLLGNSADAEDVVQETFAGAFRGLAGFGERAAVRTWLLRILVRQAARVRQRRKRERTVSIAEDIAEQDPSLTSPSPSDSIDRETDVLAMLAVLSPEHREVLVLREFEGLSYDEIAQTLGVPQGTVESRLHRARRELRERFRGYW